MFPKVELHVHLDGAIKHSTAWELIKAKNLPLPGNGSLQELIDSVVVKKPDSLQTFLLGFGVFLPAIVGDLAAIERIAYEFCEQVAANNVIYAEARYCPHLLLAGVFNNSTVDYINHNSKIAEVENVTVHAIVEAVNQGFARGEEDFGVIARSILSCIRGKPEWSREILELCVEFRDKGVVGIDIAGNEGGIEIIEGEENEERMLDKEDVEVFCEAAQLGIHRTVHAGEAGPALMVKKALNVLAAQRIGHGYRVLDDENIYRECLERNVHFECCPTSSILTGSVALDLQKGHPILQFAKDGASFSISSDDPTVTNTQLADEYALLSEWGLTESQLQQTNIEAMKNSFADPQTKEAILKRLYKAYGMND